MFKKGLLALTLVFSLPVFAAEHWIDVRVPDKSDTVKVYCNAGRQSGQAKEILNEMGYTHVENAGGLKDIEMPKVKG
ncbi:TPA: rhodanese-like domain-containing protein [Escherichia albertii]